jgi:nicotinamidase-related amidase
MGSWWSSFIMEGSPAACLDPRLPLDLVEEVFPKHRYSAFPGTGLAAFLERRSASALVLCGFQTHICVESTARDAFDRGYDVVVVRDACGSVAPELHEAALVCMGHALASVVTLEEAVGWIGSR